MSDSPRAPAPESTPQPFANGYVLAATCLVEGGLLVLALLLGGLAGIWPLTGEPLSPRPYLLGTLAAVPLLIGMFAVYFAPGEWFADIHDHARQVVQPCFRDLGPLELATIALLAALGEEAFFRGFLLSWLHRPGSDPAGAILLTALAFGALHWVSPTYVVLACLAGLYLGWVRMAAGDLLTVVVAHAVYDFAALMFLLHLEPLISRPKREDRPDEPDDPFDDS